MINRSRVSTLVVAAAMLWSVGCVSPGIIDPTVLNRYQRALVERGVRQRGSKRLEPYVPAPWVVPPKLPVEVDERTGKKIVRLGLNEAIMRALANNVEVQVLSYDPAIAREQMVQAAAEFDYVISGTFTYEKVDESTDSNFGGGRSDAQTWQVELQQKTITGAEWSLGWSASRTWDNQAFRNFPTRYEPRLFLELMQPLLRDAWPVVNLARLRIARLNRKTSEQVFRQRVEEIITEVIATYWLLYQTRGNVEITEKLLEITVRTRDRIAVRRGMDATMVELKQAEAAVAARRAFMIETRKTVFDAQDRLARLLGDSQVNILSEFEMIPITSPGTEELKLDPTDQLITALHYNPVLEQARLAIAVAAVSVEVAENQTLPRLQFSGRIQLQGLDNSKQGSSDQMWSGNFLSYSVGLLAEYPIGNRERIAQLWQRRYERNKAVKTLQDAIDQVGTLVDERVRQVRTSFEVMKAQRVAVEAATENLKALEVTEKIAGRLTPAFLQTKLSAQEDLAQAAQNELRAMVEYNVALVELARATGTVVELHGVKLAMPVATGEVEWPPETQEPTPAGIMPRP